MSLSDQPQQLALDYVQPEPEPVIPYGYCSCGCGRKTKIAVQSSTKLGWVNGEPVRYISGHNKRPDKWWVEAQRARWGNKTLAQRFWEKVNRTESCITCWRWTGATDGHGYGQMRGVDRPVKAHRVSWELARGPIPAGRWVLHRCDNPRCVRPSHLWLGTAADNTTDMIRKHRRVSAVPTGDAHWTRRMPEKVAAAQHASRVAGRTLRGEAKSSAKLTEASVREMRALYDSGVSCRQLAKRFGVCHATTTSIVYRRKWTHVT